MVGRVTGTGSYVPENYYDNYDLEKFVDTSDSWIRERTGITRRHIISEEETTVTMAWKASERALEDAKIHAEEIDLIIVATISSNVVLPCTACEVQKKLGAKHAVCFDLNAACTGFLFAYNTAQTYIAAGLAKCALVIGTESLSKLVDWTDRSTCILFGDGAGAAILQAEEGDFPSMVFHSNGAQGEALSCGSRADYIHMDGQAVFKFAVRQVPLCISELLEKEGLAPEDIDYFILHQANQRIVEAVARRLGLTVEKFPMNLQEYGNTSSASIPILLAERKQSGVLKKGQKIVLAGFGAGLSWGATLIEW